MILLLLGYVCLAVAGTLFLLTLIVVAGTWSVGEMDATSNPLNDESHTGKIPAR
jgi:hypothetical protein